MANVAPILNQLNIVAEDFDATLSFYRKLGVDISEGVSHDGIRHAEVSLANGLTLEIDNRTLARTYNAAWRRPEGGTGAVIGFAVPTRESVDDLYRQLIADGCQARQPPYDAFWGARYAVIADPAGNDVGLMSPIDEDRKTWPPTQSPAP